MAKAPGKGGVNKLHGCREELAFRGKVECQKVWGENVSSLFHIPHRKEIVLLLSG